MKCKAGECDREAVSLGWCMKHYVRMRRTGRLDTVRHMGDFWSKVKKGAPTECWPWLGFVKGSGHGLTSMKGLLMHTSRKAWILARGPIEGDWQVLHRCDNALCCNPAHMYLGNRRDNILDQWHQLPPDERGHNVMPCKLTWEQLEEMWAMRRKGAKLQECAKHFNVHISTICRYVTLVRKKKLEKIRADRLSKTATA